MSLRVAFDIDGVLADFRTAFQQAAQEAGVNNRTAEAESPSSDPLSSRDIKAIWEHVKRTPNWWTKLHPYEPGQLVRLYELARRWKWEVVFMTRRPSTEGDPVQFQTQWWIEQQGFYYPAVVTVPGSRGELANALRLDVIVDDQLLDELGRNSRNLGRLIDDLSANPSSLVFGRSPQSPGPGEPGFVFGAAR